MNDATRNPLYTTAGALRIYGELARLSFDRRLHYNRLVDINHDPKSGSGRGGFPASGTPVLRRPDHPMEHHRFNYAEQELGMATTEEAACLGMIPTPNPVYSVANRGWRGVYADIESASMAWSTGDCVIGAGAHAGVEAHHTVAEALEASGQRADTMFEQRPLGHYWALAVLRRRASGGQQVSPHTLRCGTDKE